MRVPGTDIVTWGLVRVEEAVLIYFCLVNSFYALLLVCAYWEMRQHLFRTRGESRWRLLGSRAAPNISMIAPAYNEAASHFRCSPLRLGAMSLISLIWSCGLRLRRDLISPGAS